jgi:hypothetical protein
LSGPPGEREPLAIVIAELERLADDASVPDAGLTEGSVSTAYAARPWRPARIVIRREITTGGSSSLLHGEIAHE